MSADDVIFLTGGSGFLGSALLHQIITSTQFPRLVLLCRGGRSLGGNITSQAAVQLCNDTRIDVFDGDVCLKNFGLGAATAEELQTTVKVVIHAASSINLKHSLSRLAPTIIQGTLNAAEFALGCKSLHRFVYISSAYANAYLHYLEPSTVPFISERIHPLREGDHSFLDTELEWAYLQEHGTTPQFETTPFPFAYAYAKHLTERLLINRFPAHRKESTMSTAATSSTSRKSQSSARPTENVNTDDGPIPGSKLVIVRPSIIGPALASPSPGWLIPTSSPVTGFLNFIILTTARSLSFYSSLPGPSHNALIDEVPVDIVVNRVLIHLSHSTSSIVHANRQLSTCHSFGTYLRSAQKLRRLPWSSRVLWDRNSASRKLCEVAKLYQVSGCTFEFDDERTRRVWEGDMSEKERERWPLFAGEKYAVSEKKKRKRTGSDVDHACDDQIEIIDLTSREGAFRELSKMYLEKKKWPGWVLPMLYA